MSVLWSTEEGPGTPGEVIEGCVYGQKRASLNITTYPHRDRQCPITPGWMPQGHCCSLKGLSALNRHKLEVRILTAIQMGSGAGVWLNDQALGWFPCMRISALLPSTAGGRGIKHLSVPGLCKGQVRLASKTPSISSLWLLMGDLQKLHARYSLHVLILSPEPPP